MYRGADGTLNFLDPMVVRERRVFLYVLYSVEQEEKCIPQAHYVLSLQTLLRPGDMSSRACQQATTTEAYSTKSQLEIPWSSSFLLSSCLLYLFQYHPWASNVCPGRLPRVLNACGSILIRMFAGETKDGWRSYPPVDQARANYSSRPQSGL